MKQLKTRDFAEIAVFAALLCVLSPFSIAIGPVPISLATLFVCLAAGTLGLTRGTLAVAVYLLLGAMGLPVFSGFGAGLAKLVGPTGGYLIGYLPLAMLTGLFADRRGFGFWKYPVGMIAGTVVLYALGTAWFMVSLGRGFAESLAICVTPFLIGDAAKIVAASLLSPVLRTRALRRNV